MGKGGKGGVRWAFYLLAWSGVIIALTCQGVWASGGIPPGFVEIRDVVPDIVMDIRYYTAHNFVGTRVDGYHAPKCYLTRPAAQALAAVQADLLPFGFSLKIYDCYRPQKAVDHFVRWAKMRDDTLTKAEFYPLVDKRNLFKDGYIAARSGHSRGSTVDLTIVPLPVPPQEVYVPHERLRACYLSREERFGDNSIDMGTGFDCFDERSHTVSARVGLEARLHRALLKAVMERHGFVPYDKEWWHFTLKNEPFPERYFDFDIQGGEK
ncbi:MAG: M15 family metallopeptidase, partial [Syntrophales bacterium]|nr:M15 family metallopeptidase [Syntrophales bacterium]